MLTLRSLASRALSEVRMKRIEKSLTTIRPIVPHPPSPRQAEFLSIESEEALYGGAAGGGKTDACLMTALQYIDYPEYSSAIFRREKKQHLLEGAPLALLNKWLEASKYPARWDEETNSYYFPSGASLHFGWAQNMKDMERRYQGTVFQNINFDELTQWEEPLYLYMFSRLRRLEGSPIPIRMRGYTNPGGPGHPWVKKRFVAFARNVVTGSDARTDIKKANVAKTTVPAPAVYASPPSEEAKKFAQEHGIEAQPAFFVPAFVYDNPGLDKVKYERQLMRLDPVTRAKLMNGDWDVVSAGRFFRPEWFKMIKAAPTTLRPIRSWDFAATEPAPGKDPDWSAGVLIGIERTGALDPSNPFVNRRCIISDVVRFQESPGQTEINVYQTAVRDTKRVPVLLEQEPGSSGKQAVHNFRTKTLFGWPTYGAPRTGGKDLYWAALSSVAELGNLYLVEAPWNLAFIEELSNLPVGHDDMADASSLGLGFLMGDVGSAADRTRMLTMGMS